MPECIRMIAGKAKLVIVDADDHLQGRTSKPAQQDQTISFEIYLLSRSATLNFAAVTVMKL